MRNNFSFLAKLRAKTCSWSDLGQKKNLILIMSRPYLKYFVFLLVVWPHPLLLLGQIFFCQFDQLCHLRSRRVKMAAFAVARSSCGLFHGLRISFGSLTLPKHGAIAAAVPQTNLLRQCRRYSVSHMSVKERIDKKRKAALVGGGQNRIDAQHKRVIVAEH